MQPNGEGLAPVQTRGDFARELTRLRERAGRSVRQVAKDADLPFSTVGGYFSGRHLPPLSQPQVLPKILAACGVVGDDEVRLWREVLTRLRHTGRTRADPASPYRGLATFEPGDAEWFFGRSDQVRSLTAQVENAGAEGGIVTVVGASGSGKSSLLRAGLIPNLRKDWSILRTSPAQERPEPPPDRPLLVIVDHFEELFSGQGEEADRQDYIDWVTGLPAPGLVVVLGLRADFFARALRYRRMFDVLRKGQHLVTPMSRDDVVQAVTGPAHKAGVAIETGLVDLLLRELTPALRHRNGNAAHEIGALPLLSHALMQTWRHDSRHTLKIADYVAVGGIEGAVAATAEQAYQALDPEQQALVKTVFLRLVHIGDGVADTRRRVGIDEFLGDVEESDLALVLGLFVEQRLITADLDTVEITHEALISAWPRLQSWLDEDRAGLLAHRRLTVAARQWESSGHDPALTLRGVPLAQVLALRGEARFSLSNEEREFVDDSERQAEEERRRRRRGVLRLRWLTAFLAVLTLVAAVLGIDATRQRGQAATQRDLAVSRLLALRSSTLLPSDPSLAGQLAVAAYRAAPTTEARSAVLGTTRMPSVTRLLGPAGVVQAVATVRDGEIIVATGTDGRIWLWRRDSRNRYQPLPQPVTAPAGELYALAVDPGGRTLVAGGLAGVVHRWAISDDTRLVELPPLPGPASPIHGLAYSPDGATLAVGTTDRQVRLHAADGTLRTSLEAGTEVQAVRFSPDGSRLVAAGSGGVVLSWPASGGPATRLGGPATRTYRSVAFSPDGATVAAGNSDQSVYLWRTGDGSPVKTLTGGASWINAAEFSPDGHVIAVGNSDNIVRLWDVAGGVVQASLPHPGPVTALRFADGGRSLITTAGDGVVRVWRIPGPALSLSGEGVFSVAVGGNRVLAGSSGADGTMHLAETPGLGTLQPIGRVTAKSTAGVLAGASSLSADGAFAAAGRADGTVELWDVRDARTPRLVGTPSPPTGGVPQIVAFREDGTMLAVGGDDQRIRLFDLRGPGTSGPVGVLTGPTAAVYGLAFNRDGTVVAGASVDKSVWLWDIRDPAKPQVLSVINAHTNYAYSVSFSPVGDLLVTASADKTIRLWDVSDPRAPAAIGSPLTGPGGPVITTAISPDGQVLAAGGKDHLVWLWTITDPRSPVLSAAPAASGDIYSLAFTSAGTSIVVGSADHLAAVLVTDVTTAVTRICDTAGTSITDEEWAALAPGVPNNHPCGT
ncbi:nSTAND1 domain-containing NTPase [Amycolatopsis speibonae]|uniref:Helix-turn-helix domain-containing protein n=1 Tax=Amycolatopsis speibonae TaxID=1450224 RepID=A0ABV7PBS7_9PSEU